MPARQAWWPRAQARYDFPDPVAPVTRTVSRSLIHCSGRKPLDEGTVEAAGRLEVEVYLPAVAPISALFIQSQAIDN